MAVQLTQGQINELDSIAHSGQSGARVAYYTKLASFGVDYGNLALGVVLDDQLSGRIANDYFAQVAAYEGVTLPNGYWSAIGNDLMLKDFEARQAKGAVDGIYEDLSYNDIRDYHALAFGNIGGLVPPGQGVSINAWTAYAPVETLRGTAYESVWGGTWEYLIEASQAGSWLDFFLPDGSGANILSSAVYFAMVERKFDEALTPQQAAMVDRWTDMIFAANDVALETGSPLGFPEVVPNGYLVLGSPDAEAINANGVSTDKEIVLIGLGGDDHITAPAARGYVDAGAGDDVILSAGGGVKVAGGHGFDTFSLAQAQPEYGVTFWVESLENRSITDAGSMISGEAAYWVAGGEIVDIFREVEVLQGSGSGDSLIVEGLPTTQGFPRTMTFDGGAGADTVVFSDEQRAISVNLTQATNAIVLRDQTGAGVIRFNLTDVENVYTGDGDDLAIGNDAGNTFSLGDGRNTAEGRGGADVIYGGEGKDILKGETGADTLSGGGDDDELHGQAGGDFLMGLDGADSLYGGDDADSLTGGAGDDSMAAGDGADYLNGEDGADTLLGDAGGDLLIGGLGADTLLGGAGADNLQGDGGGDGLDGGAGDDMLTGGAGNDTLDGADDDDRLDGGAGSDQIVGSGGADQLYGGADDDKLWGGEGDDLLLGEDGSDRLYGGAGVDQIHGGNGTDYFVLGPGQDWFNDFVIGEDWLVGSGGTFTAIEGTSTSLITSGENSAVVPWTVAQLEAAANVGGLWAV